MGLFGFGRSKSEKLLAEMIVHNAEYIQRTEGRSRKDAEYLAICTLLNDLSRRPNGEQGCRDVMTLVHRNYRVH